MLYLPKSNTYGNTKIENLGHMEMITSSVRKVEAQIVHPELNQCFMTNQRRLWAAGHGCL